MINRKFAVYVILGFPLLLLAAGPGIRQFNTLFPATGAVVRPAQDKINDILNIKDFGALCNGVHDDTANINAAITYAQGAIPGAAGNNGAQINVPVGTCVINSTITITSQIDFIGSGRGSFFVPTNSFPINTPMFCMGPCNVNSVTAGASIQNMSIAGPASGVPITGMTQIYSQTCEENCFLRNLLIGGAPKGIDWETFGVQNSFMEDITVYPSHLGNCLTIANTGSRIEVNRMTCQGDGSMNVGIQITGAAVALNNVHVEEATTMINATNGSTVQVNNSWVGPNYVTGGGTAPYTGIMCQPRSAILISSFIANGAPLAALINDQNTGTVFTQFAIGAYTSFGPGFNFWSTDPNTSNFFSLLTGNHIRGYGELAVGANGANDNLIILGNDTHRSFMGTSDHGIYIQQKTNPATETLVDGVANGVTVPGSHVVTINYVPPSLQAGNVITINSNMTDQETITATAVSGFTYTATFTKPHTQGFQTLVLPQAAQGGLTLLGNSCSGDKSAGFIMAGAETDGCTPSANSLTPTGITMAGGIIHLQANSLGSLGIYTATDILSAGTNGVIIPALHSNSGTRYVCVNTTGVLVSQTTACSGT